MPNVSVIVPVYNTEQYLTRCIDSILDQTFTDFELILINDGSTDNSGKICNEYSKQDSRIIVIHKENGGVSSARNKGIEIARGEWITFVDSDDYIYPEMFMKMSIGNEDLKVCGYSDQEESDLPQNNLYNSMSECVEYIKKTYRHNYINAILSKIYKLSIIKQNNLKFNKSLTIGEDTLFIIKYLCHCTTIKTINYCGYFYNRPNSLASKYNFNSQKLANYLTRLHNAIHSLESYSGKNLENIHSWIDYISYNRFSEFITTCNEQMFCNEMAYYRKYCYKYHPKMSNKELIYLWGQMLFPRYFYKLKK